MITIAVLSYQNPDASFSQGHIRGRCSSSSLSICFTSNRYLDKYLDITRGSHITRLTLYCPYTSSQVYR